MLKVTEKNRRNTQKGRKKISFKNQKIFVGIDVHKVQWTVCILTSITNFRPFSMPADPEILINYLNREFPEGDYLCAYEAGFSGYGLVEALWEASIACLVVHAADIPTSDKDAEFKNDKRDALKIAKALRAGQLQSIYIPNKQEQEDRSLVRFRQQIRKDIIRQKCRIKSMLLFYNIEIPKEYTSKRWTKKMLHWLYNIELCTYEGTKALHLQLGMLTYIMGMCKNADNHLKELSRTDRFSKQVELLMSVPGFGRLRAIEFLVELGDMTRFTTLDKIANYVGLVPSSNNSGNKIIQSELTRRGHKELRTMLIEAAWVATNTDPAMTLKYGKLKQRMLAQKAIVCIARKLLSRVRYVLLNQIVYEKGIEA